MGGYAARAQIDNGNLTSWTEQQQLEPILSIYTWSICVGFKTHPRALRMKTTITIHHLSLVSLSWLLLFMCILLTTFIQNFMRNLMGLQHGAKKKKLTVLLSFSHSLSLSLSLSSFSFALFIISTLGLCAERWAVGTHHTMTSRRHAFRDRAYRKIHVK